MLNLSEIQLRISKGLEKLEDLRKNRETIREQIRFWEGELDNLRERENELMSEAFNKRIARE